MSKISVGDVVRRKDEPFEWACVRNDRNGISSAQEYHAIWNAVVAGIVDGESVVVYDSVGNRRTIGFSFVEKVAGYDDERPAAPTESVTNAKCESCGVVVVGRAKKFFCPSCSVKALGPTRSQTNRVAKETCVYCGGDVGSIHWHICQNCAKTGRGFTTTTGKTECCQSDILLVRSRLWIDVYLEALQGNADATDLADKALRLFDERFREKG